MLRNHLGLDFAGTNTAREGFDLPPMAAGDIYTVDFHLHLPHLYPSAFSFSPAIADGTLLSYTICDWIDNAITLQMSKTNQPVYGHIHLPCRVELNRALEDRRIRSRGLIEFTGERVIPGQVEPDLWSEHFARYAFARRYASEKAVLDAGCGTGYGSAELANDAHRVTGIDFSPDAVALCLQPTIACSKTCTSRRVPANNLPFRSGIFDLVVAFEVIEHLADYRAFVC